MPPKVRFTRESVLTAAFDMVREGGLDVLNARSLAARVGSSTQPLFRVFSGMDEIKEQVIQMAQQRFDDCIREYQNDEMPAYKRTGMAYIRFAREEKQLFRMMFMCEHTEAERRSIAAGTMDYVHNAGIESTGLNMQQMERFHFHMWIYVHGLASMIATGYLDLGDEMASTLITECYQGLRKQFFTQKENT